MVEILHQDDDLAVLNKPPDVSLLADRTGADNLWDHLPDLLGRKPYLVHRLDKPTSGVLLIALQPEVQKALTRAFAARRIRKFYVAWVSGQPPDTGAIDLPLRKGRKSRYRVAGPRECIIRSQDGWILGPGTTPDPEGHPSTTRVRVLLRSAERALVLLQPLSGRTHQLRVHLAWIGYPILGDQLYGAPAAAAQQAERLQLHSHRIVLPDGRTFVARQTTDWMV